MGSMDTLVLAETVFSDLNRLKLAILLLFQNDQNEYIEDTIMTHLLHIIVDMIFNLKSKTKPGIRFRTNSIVCVLVS